MNHRLEIASRLLAGMMSNSATSCCTPYSAMLNSALEQADALIRECGDQPSLAEISTIESNATLVALIESKKSEHKADEHIAAMEKQLKQEIQARLKAEDELNRLRSDCQKLVEEWALDRGSSWTKACAEELKSVLKGNQ